MSEMFQITDQLFPRFNAEIRHIDQQGVDAEILQRILNKQRPKEMHMRRLYDRYKTGKKGVPIFEREFALSDAINNKINNDYFSEIVNTKVGYFAGSPFSYSYSQVEKDVNILAEKQPRNMIDRFTGMIRNITGAGTVQSYQTQKDTEQAADLIKHFVLYNNVADLDVEITKFAEICGYAGRLLYIDTNGETAVQLVEPFECVILSRKDITEPDYAIRYFDVEVERNGEITEVRKIEFYDNQNIYFFEDGPGGIVPDPDVAQPIQAHLFDFCPLQGIPNNRELMGGPEKVLAQIDAIDRTVSDCNSEVEAFKLAYMLIIGARIDDEELQKARENGAFNLPAFGEGVDIKYLTKEINDTFVENHLNRLDKYIYKFSQTPDMSDPMNENASGVNIAAPRCRNAA